MRADTDNSVVEIFSGTSWEAEMVSSLLADAGIQSFLRDIVLNSYVYEPIMKEGVKVIILGSDHEEAKRIVDGYYRNIKGEEG